MRPSRGNHAVALPIPGSEAYFRVTAHPSLVLPVFQQESIEFLRGQTYRLALVGHSLLRGQIEEDRNPPVGNKGDRFKALFLDLDLIITGR